METPRRPGAGMVVIVACLAVTAPALAAAIDPPVYRVVDLGTLGGEASEALDINNAGQVVGWSETAAGSSHAFLYDGRAMTDLGTLPGGTSSRATAINDRSQIVGSSGINSYGPLFREYAQGFLWQGGGMRSLGALYCPCSFNVRYGTSAGYHINAAGAAVGESETSRGVAFMHAFLWRDGAMQDLGGPVDAPESAAYGIDADGRVVGRYADRATVWEAGERTDLGALPGDASSTARAINSLGQIAGESVDASGARSRAVLWSAGVPQDLGALPGDPAGQALDVNSSGQVVGRSGTMDAGVSRAVLWIQGSIVDLNAAIAPGSGWELRVATAINDTGAIVGSGLHDGRSRAFLLIPPGNPPPAAVAPASRREI